MADRGRQQPEELALRRRAPFRRAAQAAERVEIRRGPRHHGPQSLRERAVAGEAKVLGDGEDQLAAAVVLGHRIGPALVHAARHLAVGVLAGREPLQELAHDLGVPHAQQRRRRERAVADPRPLVGARAGLDRGAVAVDQDPADLGAQRARHVGRGRRQLDRDRTLARFPVRPRRLLQRGHRGGVERSRRGAGHPLERERRVHLARAARRDVEHVRQRPRSMLERVAHPRGARQATPAQELDDVARVERGGAEPRGRGEAHDAAVAVRANHETLARQRADRRRSAAGVEELGRRIHLERPQRQVQRGARGARGAIRHAVARHDRRAAGRYEPRHPGGHAGAFRRDLGVDRERRDLELEVAVAPCHGRDRNVPAIELLAALPVGPREEPASCREKRLDRELRLAGLEHAVLVEQRFVAPTVDADHGPVRLLAAHPARIAAARRILRDGLEEALQRLTPRERLNGDGADRDA